MDKAIPTILHPTETIIDTWPIIYITASGEYNGKLTITNKRLLYYTKPGIDDCIEPGSFSSNGKSNDCVEILKGDILDVQVIKSLLAKKVVLTLLDGSVHTFNYGTFNIDKVVEAINSR